MKDRYPGIKDTLNILSTEINLSRGGKKHVGDALRSGVHPGVIAVYLDKAASAQGDSRKVGPFGASQKIFDALKQEATADYLGTVTKDWRHSIED